MNFLLTLLSFLGFVTISLFSAFLLMKFLSLFTYSPGSTDSLNQSIPLDVSDSKFNSLQDDSTVTGITDYVTDPAYSMLNMNMFND